MSAISVDDLVVNYGEFTAVDHLSFAVDSGEIVALLGRNGAGKTSTIETLWGYRRPSAGGVTVLALDPSVQRDELAPRIGVMTQDGGTYPVLNPARALRLQASYFEHHIDPKVMLEQIGLANVASVPAKRLSGGERQRLALGLALIGCPKVVFLDEPTAGIDAHGRQSIRESIRTLKADGVAVVLSTHELHEVELLADRVVIIDHGKVTASGRIDDLIGKGNEVRFSGPTNIDQHELSVRLGAVVTADEPGQYRVAATDSSLAITTIAAFFSEHNIMLTAIGAARRSLEEAFIDLTSGVDETLDPQDRNRIAP